MPGWLVWVLVCVALVGLFRFVMWVLEGEADIDAEIEAIEREMFGDRRE